MANEGGYSAGSIFLQVVPSFSGFEREARRVAKGMEGIFEDSLDQAGERGASKARKHMDDALGGPAARQSGKKSGQQVGDEFSGAFETAINKRLGNALKALGKDGGDQVDAIRRRLEAIKDAKVGVDLDDAAFIAELKSLDNAVREVGKRNISIDARVNAKAAAAELAALNREVKGVDGKRINIKADFDDKASGKMATFNRLMGRSGNQAEDTANSFRTFNGILLTSVTIGPALIPILAAIAGGLLALGPAAVAAGAGLGVLAIGFSGLGNAITAMGNVQSKSAKDTDAAAKKMKNAAETVADAQTRLKRASADAAQSRSDAARRVTDAEESAARSIEAALGRQEDAEKSLQNAQKDSLKAQNDLIAARRQAQKDLDDIADRQKKNSLDERQAVIDLFNATVQYNAVQADKGSTNLEKEQSSINLENARLSLKGIRDDQKDLNAERQKGVTGSDKVKTAEDNVVQALERQKEAQKGVKDAAIEVARAQVDAARQVSDALVAQKRAGVDSAQSITDAQKGLTRAQGDYQQALYETSVLGSASGQALADAMAKLGPAGQQFAKFIFGLKDEFYAIRNVVQAGLFPGLTSAIKTLVDTYLPSFKGFMGEMAQTFGEIAQATATMLTNDTWKQFFAVFRTVSPELIKNYSIVFGNLATVLAQVLRITAPFAVEFSRALVGLTDKMVKFASSKKGQKLLTDFLDEVKRLGPPVMKFIEAVVPAFFALAQALMPLGELLLKGLTGILNWIAGMDPKVLQGIVFAVLTLVAAFQLAAGIIALVAAIFTPFGAAVGGIVVAIVALIGILVYLYTTSDTARAIMNAVFHAIATAVKFYFSEIIIPYWKLLWTIIKAVAQGLAYAWVHWIWPALQAFGSVMANLWNTVLKPIFSALWELIKTVFNDIKFVWENVLWPVLKVIGQIVLELWELAFKVAFKAISVGFDALGKALKWTWDKVIFPVIKFLAKSMGIDIENGAQLKSGLVHVFVTAIDLIKTAWDKLADFAKKPIKFILDTVFNHGLIDGFNFLADKLGMDKVAYIPIPKGFKDGGVDSTYGVRPGYTPGRDTHMIAVGGGEAILRPELTRALGSEWVYAANARAKNGGVNGARRFLGGFKDGGVAWPVPGAKIGTPFGQKGPMWSSGYHTGTDFPAPVGTPIHAVRPGQVMSTAWSSWGGHLTKIWEKGLGDWLYAHQSRQMVNVGDNVSLGQEIGLVGATGNVTGPHLHLELRVGNTPIDPMRVLSGADIGKVEKGKNPLEKIFGGLKNAAGWVKDAVANPLNWLKGKVEGPINKLKEKFGDNWLTQGMAKLPERFFGPLVDKIKGLVGIGSGNQDDMGKYTGTTSDLQKMVQGLAASKFGWSGNQWSSLNWLVSHESSWNPNAQNPTSSAYGLFQFLDGTWKGYGPKTSDPAKQAEYGMQYIKERYGSPEGAKAFWEGHHWYADGGVVPGGAPVDNLGGLPDNGTMMYDNGGYLPPGLTTVVNLTGKPEPVFTSQQFEGMQGGSSGIHYEPHFNASDLTADDVMDDFRFEVRRLTRGS